MAIEYLGSGVGYRKGDGSLVLITRHPVNCPIYFAEQGDAAMIAKGALFSFDKIQLETLQDAVSGMKGRVIKTAYLEGVDVIAVSDYVGTVHVRGDNNGYIALANQEAQIFFEAGDLPMELANKNIEGKVVSFNGIRYVDNRAYATGIQVSTILLSANNRTFLAKVDFFDSEEGVDYLSLSLYFNSKVLSALYKTAAGTDSRQFNEDDLLLVRANVNENMAVTITEVLNTVDRRKGVLKTFKNLEDYFVSIVDESNVPLNFRYKAALVEPSSLAKLAVGTTVSYNLKLEHRDLVPYNIRLEN